MTEEERKKLLEMFTKGGNVKIGQISIGDHNTLNYNEGEKSVKPRREVTFDDLVTVLRSDKVVLPSLASITIAYAICRDVYKWDVGQADFERKMTVMGVNCTPGTIANTLRNNPYMRDDVSKWATLGAKQDVLKLRDNIQEAIEGLITETPTT